MKKLFSVLAAVVGMTVGVVVNAQEKPQALWIQFDDRFTANEVVDLSNVDSIDFKKATMKFYKHSENTGQVMTSSRTYRSGAAYQLGTPERYLVKPWTYYSNDYTNENSQFCFQRSAESEHFVIFWAKGLTLQRNGNLTGGASTSVCNVNTLLKNAEKIWDVYVKELGFLEPGNSTTDNVKIHMYVVNQSEWRADGSGVGGQYWVAGSGSTKTAKEYRTGMFHCNAWAASSNVTVAHEIGHTFQYLVSADLGDTHGLNYGFGANASGGNGWWEDCANWQAHKVYPAEQFTTNWGNNQEMHHMNIMSENARYNNCYYHDWWCQLHGLNTIARVWRESIKPEDPIEAYMRIFGLTTETFADELYEGYAHIASMDIDRWKQYGQGLIGSERQRLIGASASILENFLNGDNSYWVVDPNYCPENYGYNANPMKVPAAGTEIKAHFKGIVRAEGYRAIRSVNAGWRYGFVAYSSDGTRTYGEMGRDEEGDVTLTVPENCTHLWFVVMGAPKTYWRHPWDEDTSNDEQWPYAVKFDGTDPFGANKFYGDYPEDYARKDTTVVIHANLAYSASQYSSIQVPYDMDAISKALGVSTQQMKALKCSSTSKGVPGTLDFVGTSTNGNDTYGPTTSTSNDKVYGHWFKTTGDVINYNTTTSAIYAELSTENYSCKVGQYPGHLRKGKSYVFRQAFIYTHTDGKQYKATMEVHLNVV